MLRPDDSGLTRARDKLAAFGPPPYLGLTWRAGTDVLRGREIGANLAFSSSIEVKYDRRPGPLPVKNLAMGFVPAADTLDTIMKASFIYTFVGATKK